MKRAQGVGIQTLRDVQTFLDTHTDVLGDIVRSGARAKLDEIADRLSAQAAAQGSSTVTARGATSKKNELRRTLIRFHMVPIARVSAADLPPTPELAALRMPRG